MKIIQFGTAEKDWNFQEKESPSKTHSLSLPAEHDAPQMSTDGTILQCLSCSVCCCSASFVIQITISLCVACGQSQETEES